jgi:hypothetical protein
MTLKKAQKTNAPPLLPKLIEENSNLEDWSRIEKLQMYQEMCSAVRDDLAFPPEVMLKIKSADVKSVLQMEPKEEGVAWFCVIETIRKTSKNKKVFHRVKITDEESNSGWLMIWGEIPSSMKPYTLWLAKAKNDPNWGASTSIDKVRALIQ